MRCKIKIKNRMIFAYFIVFFTITSVLFGIWHYSISINEEKLFRQYMKLATIAINENDFNSINEMILERKSPLEILETEEFQRMRNKLIRINDNFPLPILYTYTIIFFNENSKFLLPENEEDLTNWIIIATDSIEINLDKPKTLPGFIYNTRNFPEILHIMNGAEFYLAKRSTYDDVYKVRAKAGVHIIYNSEGEIIGALGMDKEIFSTSGLVLSALLASIVYGFLITSFIFISLSKVRIVIMKKPTN